MAATWTAISFLRQSWTMRAAWAGVDDGALATPQRPPARGPSADGAHSRGDGSVRAEAAQPLAWVMMTMVTGAP